MFSTRMGKWRLAAAGGCTALGCLCQLQADVWTVPNYQVGDIASNDVVAPLRLVVVDPDRTEQLRQPEANKVPPIYLYCTNTVADVEAGLHAAVDEAKGKFITTLNSSFKRWPLSESMLRGVRFERFLAGYLQKNSRGFPLSTNLLRIWAADEPDELIRSEWLIVLRAAMNHCIRTDAVPPAAKGGPAYVRILPVPTPQSSVDLAIVAQQGTNLMRTNLLALGKIRQELQKQFSPDQQTTARFLMNLLKPNCRLDEELTQRSRAARTETILAAAEYPAGALILKAGQVVDRRAKAALEQMRIPIPAPESEAPAPPTPPQSTMTAGRERWLIAALAAAACVVGLASLWRTRRLLARHESLLPARAAGSGGALMKISCPACAEPITLAAESDSAWRERALAAERRAEQARALARARWLPQFAQWLKAKLVRGLISQRNVLLEAQQQASRDMEELEQRLAEVQAPLAERLRAYQARIADLEQQLAAKDAENCELLKAKIELTRKKLADTQIRGDVAWN